MDRTKTSKDIKEIFDISDSTLARYVKAGLPHTTKGKAYTFNEAEVAAWLKEHPELGGNPGRPASPMSEAMAKAKLRKEEALATKYEVELQRGLGNLLPSTEVVAIYSEIITNAKHKLLSLGSNVAGQLEGLSASDIQAVIDTRIGEILRSLAEAGEPSKVSAGLLDSPTEA